MSASRAGAVRVLVFAGLVVLRAGAPAGADEIRLHDGEVLHGSVDASESGRLTIVTGAGRRRLRAREIAERIPGPAPQEEVLRREADLTEEDADGRVILGTYAWRRGLDRVAQRLWRAALERDPAHAEAQAWLGRVETADGWEAGWPAPFSPPGRPGPRWGRRAAAPALDRALAWLSAHQDADGRVDADGFARHCPEGDACPDPGGGHHGERTPCAFDGATTAVAVLAWLAHGSTPVSGPHHEAVGKGLAFCTTWIRSGRGGFDGIWNLAFATQAVADGALVTRDPALRETAVLGVERLLGAQLSDGGWSYVHGVGDVPTTAVVTLALGVAAQAGIGIPSDRVERALAFLEARVDARTKRSEYHEGAERVGYTPTTANAAATLAARAYLGALDDTPDLGARIALISKRKPKWELRFEMVDAPDGRRVRAQVGNLYPFAWYLTTLAMHARGGSGGSGWQRSLHAALRRGQDAEGHRAGSWEPLGTYSSSGGRAFITALCALMWATPYRYAR